MTDKKIRSYEWEDIGIEHSQYFTGRSTAFSRWDDVFVGVGNDITEAVGDALDTAAMCDYDTTSIDRLPTDNAESVDDYLKSEGIDPDEDVELYYHVALYVKGE